MLMRLHDSLCDELASIFDGIGDPNNCNIADDVIGFVDELQLLRFKLVCKNIP